MWALIEALNKELIVLFFSVLPIVELRGAIPLGISLGLSPLYSGILAIIANMVLAALLLKLLYPLMGYFEKTKIFHSTVGWVKRRSMKRASTIKKYSLIGLYLFVAIPLPTTGVWTASVIASLLKLDYKKSLLSLILGVLTSGIIVLGISYEIFS